MRLLSAVTALALFCGSTASAATTYGLYARSKAPGQIGDFSIEFEDRDGDGHFSLDEMTSFSGITLYQGDAQEPLTLTSITGVPNILGYSDGDLKSWNFAADGAAISSIHDDFDYDMSPLSAEVPLPASGLLLLGGLVAIGAARRRPRR